VKSRVPTEREKEASRRRVEAALRKAERGEELTEKETMIVQWERALGGCHACGPRIRVFHSPRRNGGDR